MGLGRFWKRGVDSGNFTFNSGKVGYILGGRVGSGRVAYRYLQVDVFWEGGPDSGRVAYKCLTGG